MVPLARLTLIAAFVVSAPAWSKGVQAPAYTSDEAETVAEMHALETEIGAGKRDFIEEQLDLSLDEDAKFWPIYDAHQKALQTFNQRRIDNILEYARAYNAGAMDDATAIAIAEEALDIDKDEAVQMERTFHKLKKAIPATQAARYLQVENKLRAVVRFEQAAQVPYAR